VLICQFDLFSIGSPAKLYTGSEGYMVQWESIAQITRRYIVYRQYIESNTIGRQKFSVKNQSNSTIIVVYLRLKSKLTRGISCPSI